MKAPFARWYTEIDTINVGPPDFHWRAFVYVCHLLCSIDTINGTSL